jgi:hypothetical protein
LKEEGKEHLKVSISKSVLSRFRDLVGQKHPGFERGPLSFEVETALSQYIATYHIQQHSTKNVVQAEKANPGFKVFKLKDDIYKYLIDSGQYFDVPQFIADRQLFHAIGVIKGIDNRTVRKWFRLLQDFGCVKKSGLHQFEFV